MFSNYLTFTMSNSARTRACKRFVLLVLIYSFISACSVVTQDSAVPSDSTSNPLLAEAVSAMKSGEIDKAQKLLIRAITQDPQLASAHINLAITLITQKSYGEAERSLKSALKVSPNNIIALNQLGYLYRTTGKFSLAEKNYLKAIDINYEYANAHLNLGILYDLYMYDLGRALKHYKIYKKLSKSEDKQVEKWIFDLERRHKKSLAQK